MTLPEKLSLYRVQFGHTFNLIALDLNNPSTAQRLEALLDEAIAGSRGPITDSDLGISVPKDALI